MSSKRNPPGHAAAAGLSVVKHFSDGRSSALAGRGHVCALVLFHHFTGMFGLRNGVAVAVAR